MEVILNKNVESFTGSLNKSYGYAIQRRGKRFFSLRSSRGQVPPDGHWRFIKRCAQMALNKMYFVDIRVTAEEVRSALREADLWYGDLLVKMPKSRVLDAAFVLEITKRWAL